MGSSTVHENMFSIQMLLHFSQIVPRVCTLVLFIFMYVFLSFLGGYIYFYFKNVFIILFIMLRTLNFI